jgi:hypothetical protein
MPTRREPQGALACSYLHGLVAMGRPQEIVPFCAYSFRAAAQNSSDFHVFALSLRMGQGQLVLCHSFVIALGVGEHESHIGRISRHGQTDR